MRTFEMSAALDFKLVVPDEFLKDMREQAASEDASEFLKIAQKEYPEDDDAFLLMILNNGIKRLLRNAVMDCATASNLGGTFAPARMSSRACPPGEPVLASQVDAVIPE
jgi:hypothetical protein